MVERNSEWEMRAPTAGMETKDLLRNAYAKEFARFQMGEQAKRVYMDSFAQSSPMGAGGGMGGRRLPQAARAGVNQNQQQVGEIDDTLAAFGTQLEHTDKLLEIMRKAWEAQQPGFADYAKQAAMQFGPMLLGL